MPEVPCEDGHCQQLLSCGTVISLSWIQHFAGKRYRSLRSVLYLTQHSTNGKVWDICVQYEWFICLWTPQQWHWCHGLLELAEGLGMFFPPAPLRLWTSQLIQWSCGLRQVLDETPVIIDEAEKIAPSASCSWAPATPELPWHGHPSCALPHYLPVVPGMQSLSWTRRTCVVHRNVAGAFDRPKGIQRKWNRLYLVINAIFPLSSSAMGICQYPEFISKVLNHCISAKLLIHSSIKGSGQASCIVAAFKPLKSMLSHQLPSFFCTSTGGEAHSDWLG